MNNILKLGALAAVSTLVLAGCAANEDVAETPTSAAERQPKQLLSLQEP